MIPQKGPEQLRARLRGKKGAAVPGRSVVQTTCLHENVLDDDCNCIGNYARSGYQAPVYENAGIPYPAEVDCLDRNRGDGWKVSQRGKSPDLLGYNMNVAVWVGLIALLGVDAETGVFMLLYLELAYEQRKRSGQMRTRADLRAAIEDGAVKRLRPNGGGGNVFGARANHVVPWSRLRRHAPYRRANDRRHLYLILAGAAGLSRRVRDLERF